MKSAIEVANKVDDSRFDTRTAPGKAQQVILNALGIEASSFGHANAIFEALGITVIAKRVGRSSVPEVHIREEGGYVRTDYGDYDGTVWSNADNVNLSAIKEWMVK